MSENKKDKKLPGKDYFHKEKSGNKAKLPVHQVSEEEKAEFTAVFGEDDVKAFEPGKKQENKKSSNEKTMLFKKVGDDNQETALFDEETSQDTLSGTRNFSLRSKAKKSSEDKNRKNLMQSIRVLAKNKEDRAILEAAPAGKGGRNFADSVKAQQGEDIFDAVERAYSDKLEKKNKPKEKISAIKKRNDDGAEKAAENADKIRKDLDTHKKAMIIYAVLFVLSLMSAVLFPETLFYAVANLLFSVAVCVLSFPIFEKSFNALRSFSAVSDTAVAVMAFFVLLHNICALALGQTGTLYTLCLIFGCFVRVCANFYRLKSRLRLNLMVLDGKRLSTLQRISLKKDTVSFTRKKGKTDESDIFYCTRAMLDTSLEEPVNDSERENKYFIFTMSLVLLACLVVGLFCFVTQMSGMSFVSALTAAVCALMPVMYDPLSRFIFYRNGERMLEEGVCISGREALSHIGRSDGFVLDAGDVFSGEVSRFRKSAISKIDQNDSAVFAALLIKEAGSVLAPCFDSFLEQMNIALPPVENFLYEERLGYSAWVLDRKVLVGNRQMLLNHSISVPTKEQEKAYAKNRYVMYVVIDGEIAATFLAGYKVLSSLRRYYRDFNKTGMVLMLNSKEAFLDEQTVAAKLSVDASSVKILSSKATAIMEKYNKRYDRQLPTGLLCAGKKRSIMHLIMGCYNANAADRFILIMLVAGQLLGFSLLVLSAVLNMKLMFNPLAIVGVRLLWSLIAGFIVTRKK